MRKGLGAAVHLVVMLNLLKGQQIHLTPNRRNDRDQFAVAVFGPNLGPKLGSTRRNALA